MKATYDSEADAMAIDLGDISRWEHCEEVVDRANVAIAHGHPVNVELLYPAKGIEDPLRAVARRYDLDVEALIAAAQAALAAPERPV
jgi:hypothetical protein